MFNALFWAGGPIIGFIGMVGAVMLLTVGTIFYFRRHPDQRNDEDSQGAREMVVTSVATVNAVLLAFVIVVVWEKYSSVQEAFSAEAGALINIARDASALDDPLRTKMLEQMELCASQVITNDWPALSASGHKDMTGLMQASATLSTLWDMTANRKLEMTVATENMMDNLSDLSRERVHRFALARAGVTDTLWVILLVATAATIVIGIAQYRRSAVSQMPLFLFYSFFLGALLWLIADSDNPFGGTQVVAPLPFVHALAVIKAHQHAGTQLGSSDRPPTIRAVSQLPPTSRTQLTSNTPRRKHATPLLGLPEHFAMRSP